MAEEVTKPWAPISQSIESFWICYETSGEGDLKKFCADFEDESFPKEFLADFIKKVDDENNQKSPRSTMISHFASLKKKMKARISTKNNRAKKAAEKRALADRELEEMERNASVEHLRYVLVTTDQEIKQNLEILKIKAEDNNEAYKKNQSLRAAEAKLVKKAQKKIHSRINLCNEFKGINIERALHGDN
ncbi:uncharacterized protein LOC111207563 [Brassica napus]|uniref:uncharacterized protein LOC111207563 n=1 Tax=Brassica napus TaxID=3708 RepID=UPI000BBF12F1|nr:uncharacterized protein LOC111207563 [Brassica napus]